MKIVLIGITIASNNGPGGKIEVTGFGQINTVCNIKNLSGDSLEIGNGKLFLNESFRGPISINDDEPIKIKFINLEKLKAEVNIVANRYLYRYPEHTGRSKLHNFFYSHHSQPAAVKLLAINAEDLTQYLSSVMIILGSLPESSDHRHGLRHCLTAKLICSLGLIGSRERGSTNRQICKLIVDMPMS